MDDFGDIYYVDSRNAPARRYDNRPNYRPAGWPGMVRPTVHYAPPARPVLGQQWAYGPPQSSAAMLFGKLTTGQIVEMVSQIFAALQSLPNAPVATRDIEADVGNLILYQGALASHAKRDEQVRTLGSLVAKLVG